MYCVEIEFEFGGGNAIYSIAARTAEEAAVAAVTLAEDQEPVAGVVAVTAI